MFIEPISKINSISNINKINEVDSNEVVANRKLSAFSDIFLGAINDYTELEEQVNSDVYDLVTGQSDDLHNITINAEKAELSLNLFIQLRNKAMDAYKELMGMSV